MVAVESTGLALAKHRQRIGAEQRARPPDIPADPCTVMAVATVSTCVLRLLAAIFAALAVKLLVSPVESMQDHNLDISQSPASGLAEIRAYYLYVASTI